MRRRAERALVATWFVAGILAACGRVERRDAEVPFELCDAHMIKLGEYRAFHRDLVKCYYDWDVEGRTISISHGERDSLSSPWTRDTREFSTQYFVVRVHVPCTSEDRIRELYVVGLYTDGDSCVEHWTFEYSESDGAMTERREEIFRGGQFGLIADVVSDPDGRYVFFLTWPSPAFYRLHPRNGRVKVVVEAERLAQLATPKEIRLRRHPTEGLAYLLNERWVVHGVRGDERSVVLFDPKGLGRLGEPVELEFRGFSKRFGSEWSSSCE